MSVLDDIKAAEIEAQAICRQAQEQAQAFLSCQEEEAEAQGKALIQAEYERAQQLLATTRLEGEAAAKALLDERAASDQSGEIRARTKAPEAVRFIMERMGI